MAQLGQPGAPEGETSRSNVRYVGDEILTAQSAFGELPVEDLVPVKCGPLGVLTADAA